MKKVLITGGSGFIGSHVSSEILKRGMMPIRFDRYYLNPSEGIFIGDVRDAEAIKQAVGKVDYVINLAGILGTQETINDPIPSVQTNIIGGINVFDACIPSKFHKVKAVQIGVGNYWMNNSYSITKDTATRFALMYNKEHGTKIAVVRALNAYGPGQSSEPVRKIIPTFINLALKNEPIEIYGDGEQIMDMIYVGDLAKILVDAAVNDHGIYDKEIEAGTGRRTTVNWIAKKIIEACGSTSIIKHSPMRPGEEEGAVVLSDPEKLKPLGDYQLTKFEEGVLETVDFYKR